MLARTALAGCSFAADARWQPLEGNGKKLARLGLPLAEMSRPSLLLQCRGSTLLASRGSCFRAVRRNYCRADSSVTVPAGGATESTSAESTAEKWRLAQQSKGGITRGWRSGLSRGPQSRLALAKHLGLAERAFEANDTAALVDSWLALAKEELPLKEERELGYRPLDRSAALSVASWVASYGHMPQLGMEF